MKRIVSLLLLSVMFVFCLTGCGGREKYAGKWEAKEMNVNGNVIDSLSGVPLNVMMRFQLNDSGSAEWASPLSNVKDPSLDGITASWKIKDGKIILTVNMKDEKNVIEFTDEDGRLVYDRNGSKLYLDRVDDYSPVDSQAILNSFNGFGSMFGG
jgi:hypothetical protein